MFRDFKELLADPLVTTLEMWSGYALRSSSMANNNDWVEHVALCTSDSALVELADYAMCLSNARWDWSLLSSLPFRLELERWSLGSCVEGTDIRPAIDVHGVADQVQVVPCRGLGMMEAWSLLFNGEVVPAEQVQSKLSATECKDASFTAPPWTKVNIPVSDFKRPISPLYAEHGKGFVDWVSESAYYGFAAGWDGSIPPNIWVPALAFAKVNEEPFSGDLEDFLEERAQDQE